MEENNNNDFQKSRFNNNGEDVLVSFVDAVASKDASTIVRLQKEHNIKIPEEFTNLSEATKGVRNLIYTANKFGEDSPEYKAYLNNVWLRNKQANPETGYWRDSQTNKLYYSVEEGGRKHFYESGTDTPLTDPNIISRLNKVGTDGSGEAKMGEKPDNLIQRATIVELERAIKDAKKFIHAGAGDIIEKLNKIALDSSYWVKIEALAIGSPGDSSFNKMYDLLEKNQVVGGGNRIASNAYFSYIHTMAKFETIASKTSGESRLTDEDAERYMRAYVNPKGTPESILDDLGQLHYSGIYERARKKAWDEYIHEQSRPDQKDEYWFNKNRWDREEATLEAKRESIVSDFANSPQWTPKFSGDLGSTTSTQSEVGDKDSYKMVIESNLGTFHAKSIGAGDLPPGVFTKLKKGKGRKVTAQGYESLLAIKDTNSDLYFLMGDPDGWNLSDKLYTAWLDNPTNL